MCTPYKFLLASFLPLSFFLFLVHLWKHEKKNKQEKDSEQSRRNEDKEDAGKDTESNGKKKRGKIKGRVIQGDTQTLLYVAGGLSALTVFLGLYSTTMYREITWQSFHNDYLTKGKVSCSHARVCVW